MLDSGISLWDAHAKRNSWRASERTLLPCMENICENEGNALGSSRLSAWVMHISMGIGTMEAVVMAEKSAGSLLTKNDRNKNIVLPDSLRLTPLDRTSKVAVIISEMRTSWWPCSDQYQKGNQGEQKGIGLGNSPRNDL